MAKRKYYIYKHIFPNNKVYIGITCQKPELRWGNAGEGYLQVNKYGKPTQAKMYHAIRKYGWENTKHEIIETVVNKEEAEKKERYYITKVYKSHIAKYGYNIMRGGDYNGKFTTKTKNKISKSIKLAYQTSEAMWLKRLKLRQYRWWNNGIEEVRSIGCPGENWIPGKKFRLPVYKFYTAKYFREKYKRFKRKFMI